MAASEEPLIDMSLIESSKENIASLPQGRSAKHLAAILSPIPSSTSKSNPNNPNNSSSPCTDSDTQTLNTALRAEYEKELHTSLPDSDDPLDIYDRYIKWTLASYPSAQNTPQSGLQPLLERATRHFLTSAHYRNDIRYLRFWLLYIQLGFSAAPRETYAFLSRHGIGGGLAAYYEEFAGWLEREGRWAQADEVFRLGVEREARPVERLGRRWEEMKRRREVKEREGEDGEGPRSPAMPLVRQALGVKVDPFALPAATASAGATVGAAQGQQQRPGSGTGMARSGKPKMAIFSDSGADTPPAPGTASANTKGWESIRSLKEQRKENTIEAKQWAGETLKSGKRAGTMPKMEVFKDQTLRNHESSASASSSYPLPSTESSHPGQVTVNPKSGKQERVFVNLEAVYGTSGIAEEEMSFEELRALHRGWYRKDFGKKNNADTRKGDDGGLKALRETAANARSQPKQVPAVPADAEIDSLTKDLREKAVVDENSENLTRSQDTTTSVGIGKDANAEGKATKVKKMKVREIKQEPQTVKLNLESPTHQSKLKRKNSAEPTMTFVSKAAMEDIYDMFNKPLKCETAASRDDTQSGVESDDDDDDYASESTGTGMISGTDGDFDETANFDGTTSASLKLGREETLSSEAPLTEAEGASEWSSFTASKIPRENGEGEVDVSENITNANSQSTTNQLSVSTKNIEKDVKESGEDKDLHTPTMLEQPQTEEQHQPRYIPLPPEDYEPPTRPYRDPEMVAQNRLPFMTPIVEQTESSLGAVSIKQQQCYFDSKTPSRPKGALTGTAEKQLDELLDSSPFIELNTPKKNKARCIAVDGDSPPKKVKHSPSRPAVVKATVPKAAPIKGPIINDVQCNPVYEGIRGTILKNIHPPMSSFSGFFDNSNVTCSKGQEIQKFVRTQNAKKSRDPERTQTQAIPPIIRLEGASRVYAIKRELGKGAFAPVYLVDSEDLTNESNDASSSKYAASRQDLEALKLEQTSQPWEFYIIRSLYSRLGAANRASASIVVAHECHVFANEGYLILDYCNQGTLLDLVNVFAEQRRKAGKPPGEGMDEVLAMFFAVELLRVVEESHRAGILHGDLKADNCLVRLLAPDDEFDALADGMLAHPYRADGNKGWAGKGLTLIDFGRGIDMRRFRDDVAFIADWETGPQDCPEMRNMKPWTWQIDYFGLAGTIYTLLYGQYIETVEVAGSGVGLGAKKQYRLKERPKRYWQQELWEELFEMLLNPTREDTLEAEAGRKMPLLKGMRKCRERMERWLEAEGEKKGLRAAIRRCEVLVTNNGKGKR
ncbi:MAG: hypothetical protein Q9227_002359 [Pyrenula ochraceoflavens]